MLTRAVQTTQIIAPHAGRARHQHDNPMFLLPDTGAQREARQLDRMRGVDGEGRVGGGAGEGFAIVPEVGPGGLEDAGDGGVDVWRASEMGDRGRDGEVEGRPRGDVGGHEVDGRRRDGGRPGGGFGG